MNLWAKRVGQLSLVAVALFFFFGCKDESILPGYPNPNKKFKAYYVEIPIESSVLLMDSIRTSNYNYTAEPLNRVLVGKVNDPAMGTTTATAYSQFFNGTDAVLGTTAVYDSVSLQLGFDYYVYGPTSATSSQTVSIYEVTDLLDSAYFTDKTLYFNRSTVATGALLGSKSFSVKDSIADVKIPLDVNYGKAIYDYVTTRHNIDGEKAGTRYKELVNKFKGVAIKPEAGDKILGIATGSANSRVVLHYHEKVTVNGVEKDSAKTVSLSFAGTTSFTNIVSDHGATELAGVTQYATDYLAESNNRYVQAGTGIVTKLDFSKFYEFADTVPNVIINSAELSIENVQNDLAPPSALSLRVLLNNNRWNKFTRGPGQDSLDYSLYNKLSLQKAGIFVLQTDVASTPSVDTDAAFYASGDRSLTLNYFSDTKKYTTIYTLFVQQMTVKDEKTRFKYFALTPASVSGNWPATKGVARAVFPKNSIKLKVYYTKPLTPKQ